MKIKGKDSSRTPIKTKKKNSLNRKEPLAVTVSPLDQEEDIDLDKQFVEEDECFWLSSPACSSSPLSFFQDYKFSSSLHLSVDDWLISWLSSLADSYLHLDNAEKKKQKNTETEFQEVSSDSENSKFSSDHSDSYDCCSYNISVKNSSEYKDVNSSEEPLFWPYAWKSDWSSPETWKCFSMSPRKGTTSSDSRRRSLEFGSGSPQCSSTKMIDSKVSRLGNSAKISTRKVDEGMEEEPKCVYSDLLEDDDMRKNGEESSIETVMGLEEFDGREGVESEFNDDVFSMDDDVLA